MNQEAPLLVAGGSHEFSLSDHLSAVDDQEFGSVAFKPFR